jgi:translation initiation factor IF-1
LSKHIEISGVIVDASKAGVFKILADNKNRDGSDLYISARSSGRMRMNNINIMIGDRVLVEVSPYDFTTGRIVRRVNK